MKRQSKDLLAEALDEGIQELYHVYRQTVGDYKMNFRPWTWTHDNELIKFSKWLSALSLIVLKEAESRGKSGTISKNA